MLKRFLCLALMLSLCCTAAFSEEETPENIWNAVNGEGAEATATATDLYDENTFVLSMVGDCTPGEQYTKRGYRSGYTYKVRQTGLDFPFSNVAEMFARDDLTLANCEVNFTTRKPVKKVMALMAPAEFAQVLSLGNVDVVNVYNNHSLDFGPEGKEDTKAALDAVGIGYSDKSLPYVTEIKGVKIGMISMCSAMRRDQINEFPELVDRLRNEEHCNFIILSCHWGFEEKYVIRGDQLRAEEFLDAGVDMIWGHGSHTLQPIRYYKGKLIFYSTSNFTFGANGSPKDLDTAVFQVKFHINEDKSLTPTYLTAIPFKQNFERDFRPYEITDEKARLKCLKKLYATPTKKNPIDSNLPESFLTTGEVDLTAWAAELAARETAE